MKKKNKLWQVQVQTGPNKFCANVTAVAKTQQAACRKAFAELIQHKIISRQPATSNNWLSGFQGVYVRPICQTN